MIERFLSRQKANLLRPPDRDGRVTPLLIVGVTFLSLWLIAFAFAHPAYQSGVNLCLGSSFVLLGAAERLPENRLRLTASLRLASAVAFLGIPPIFVPMAYAGFGETGALVAALLCVVVVPLMWSEILGYFKGTRDGQRDTPREGS